MVRFAVEDCFLLIRSYSNIPPNNGPLHTLQVTSSCFASECSVVPQAAKRLSKEDIQLLLTAKEADNTGD